MAKGSSKLNLINDSAMVRGAMELYKLVVKYAPHKRIKDAVFISRVEGQKGSRFITVGVDLRSAPEARAFDAGSGIHATKGRRGKYAINPRNTPLLGFQGTNQFAGRVITVKQVMHPGVAGTKYTSKATKDSKKGIRAEIAKDVKNNLRLYLRAEFAELGK